jgi:hypothetical protein
MEKEHPSKDRIIEEIKTLRKQINQLEAKISGSEKKKGSEYRKDPRETFDADIEFIGDFDVVNATGINISKGGICFEVSQSLPFDIRFRDEDKTHDLRAHLVWMVRLPNGKFRFGFRFSPS